MSAYELVILWWTGGKVNLIKISIGEAGVKRCVLRSRDKAIHSSLCREKGRTAKERSKEILLTEQY